MVDLPKDREKYLIVIFWKTECSRASPYKHTQALQIKHAEGEGYAQYWKNTGFNGGKRSHFILINLLFLLFTFIDICSLGGEATGQRFSVINEKLSAQHTEIFPTGAAQ